jgi:microcystin degradation protein MlrC
MPARFRIAYARVNQETNCLVPVPTTYADFESVHLLEGEALARASAADGLEVPGMFRHVELTGFRDAVQASRGEVEAVPLSSAWAIPGGPLDRACFDRLRDGLVSGLERARRDGPIHGVYLCLHGAMGVHGLRDPETALLRAVAEVSGGAPVVTTHDLHANLTEGRVRSCLSVVSYKTNPHRDHRARGRQAGRLLLETLRGKVRPTTAWRSLPMLLGGGTTIDLLPTMLPVFARTQLWERGAVLAASVNMCHPWNSDPELGWSTCVTTNDDPALAERLADELAELCWARRNVLPPTFASADEAVDEARASTLSRRLGAVVLADASDVVTAGATGENTALVETLLRRAPELLSYVPLRDPVAVEALWARAEGDQVEVTVGGRLDPAHNDALTVRGQVLHKRENHGLKRSVVLAVEGLRLVLVEGPAITLKPDFFTQVGLDPWKADVLVVKNFFPFRLFFAPIARKTIYVKTRGPTDFDAAFRLSFDGPMHPRDPVDDWRVADRRRRAG